MQLDLSAAFDTVNHRRLLEILSDLGVCGLALQWLQSYLTDRTQTIKVRGASASECELDCGVPQGSVLGPILFTIYTSSLGELLRQNCVKYHLYADDSQLYLTFKLNDMASVVGHMEATLALVNKWMAQHHLKMNGTEVLIISSKQ